MMKKTILLAAALLCAAGLSAKELKVLMIGNSFSNSVLSYLPRMVAAGKVHKLKIANGFIGGCTLQRHCKNLDQEKSKPALKPYTFRIPGQKAVKATISEMIKSDRWDIITIQQGSRHSPYKKETQAYGKKLIAHIRKLAPKAEIIVHQTWAYHAGHPWFTGKDAKLTQKKMHDMVTANYTELANSNKLRMIPVGNAVQLYREKSPVKLVTLDPAKVKQLKRPAVLDMTGGDIVGRMYWAKNPKPGVTGPSVDYIHLNGPGAFLQACVWYMFLFDAKAADIKVPLKDKRRALLIKCAEEAVKQYKNKTR